LVLDLHHEFENDYDGFAQFVADAIAAHTPKEDNRQLEIATLLLRSIVGLVDDITASTRSEEGSGAGLEADLRDLLTRLVGGQGLSIKALTSLLSAVGVPLGGRPGRTPKNYSSEYELKAAGKPWPVVAEHTLENDDETRQEFNGRKFSALTFEEKEILKHRVREGVRSYARRVGKLFPPRKESKVSPPSHGEQENPS
jgi:hypothetical protein